MNVGFAGLGRMGTPMARRVLEAGFPLTVWNRSHERLEPPTSAGASPAETPRALAEEAEVVITMVADADALGRPVGRRARVREHGSRRAGRADAHAGRRTERDRACETRSRRALAKAVPPRRRRRRSGDEARRQRSRGRHQRGRRRGLVLAERAGIAREAAYDVFAGGAAAAPYVLYKRDAFLRLDEITVAFTVAQMRKDLRLVFALADQLGVDVAAARATDEALERAHAEDDFASVARVIRNGS